MSHTIDTTRLVLRPFTQEDAPALCALGQQPEVARWMPDMDMDADEVTGFIAHMERGQALGNPARLPVVWAVTLRESGRLIGFCGLGPKEELGGEVELAYALSADFSRRGYATEAARAAVWWAFERGGLSTMMALAQEGNLPSRRVLEKLGFVPAGTRTVVEGRQKHTFQCMRLYHLNFLDGPEWRFPDSAEEMATFFNTRAKGYEDHMKQDPDFDAFYAQATLPLPRTQEPICVLDLGCGTGLELEGLFERAPNARVTALDVSAGMLDILQRSYAHKREQITLIQGSYLDWDYPSETFDYVLSVNTMHHFLEDTKLSLYRRILRSLKPGGAYVEADFMVDDIMMEQYRRRYHRLMDTLGGRSGDYHIDLPFTPWLQQRLMEYAGFGRVRSTYQRIQTEHSGAVLVAEK